MPDGGGGELPLHSNGLAAVYGFLELFAFCWFCLRVGGIICLWSFCLCAFCCCCVCCRSLWDECNKVAVVLCIVSKSSGVEPKIDFRKWLSYLGLGFMEC